MSVETGQVLLAETAEGAVQTLFDVEAELAEKVARQLKVPLSDAGKEALKKDRPTLEDFKRLMQAEAAVKVGGALSAVKVQSLVLAHVKNASGIDADAATVARVAEQLEAKLQAQQSFRVLPRSSPALASAALDARSLGYTVAADAVVVGSFQNVSGKVRLDVKALSTASGEVVASASVTGDLDDPEAVASRAAQSLLVSLLPFAEGGPLDLAPPKPFYERWWFWPAVGSAVALTGAAIAYMAVLPGETTPPAASAVIQVR